MLKHIVIWKFAETAEGKTKAENMELIKNNLLALTKIIPQIKKMEIGIDTSHTEMSGDMALITEFENKADLKIYAEHPEHLKVSAYVSRVRLSRTVIDFDI